MTEKELSPEPLKTAAGLECVTVLQDTDGIQTTSPSACRQVKSDKLPFTIDGPVWAARHADRTVDVLLADLLARETA